MSVPFKAVTGGPKDAYNFYQPSVRINIECAFGMLVHRFGILWKPMPIGFLLLKINVLVGCLCKLHNFCINEMDCKPPRLTAGDLASLTREGCFGLSHFNNTDDYTYHAERDHISGLLDGGQHFDDLNRRLIYRREANTTNIETLPSQIMLQYLIEAGHKRPRPSPNKSS